MRHRIAGRRLNRTSPHRIATFRNLAAAFFEHGEIETTMAKAKAVQPFIEKCITIAKKQNFAARRLLEQKLNDRMIHMWVADPNVNEAKKDNRHFDLPSESDIEFNRYGEVRKAPRLVQHIMTKVAPKFEDRAGGYTRIIKLGKHRLGDGADVVLLQLVGEEDGPEVGGGVSKRRQAADRRAEFAAKLRKSSGKSEAAAEAVDEEETATAVAEPEVEATDETTEEKTEE